jgi:cobyrinic acid a,c-diamide synthase
MAGSVAAVVHGYATLDPGVGVAGVILNRVASDGHETQLREALVPLGLPVLGALRRDDRLTWRDRHLGLVPVAEQPGEVRRALDALGAAVAERVDLAAVMALAATAAPMPLPPPGPPVRVAVAGGEAFTFTYADTVDALMAGGAEVVPFDPLRDAALPADIDGLVVGGGFPETFAAELAANRPLLDDAATRIRDGLATWAECGGLLWLARELDGHAMAGVIPAVGRMTDRLTLGYRAATTTTTSPVGPEGTEFRGHEFHYSRLDPGGDALHLEARFGQGPEGYATPRLLATYVHHHPGGDPSAVAAFLTACRAGS